jgi:hypothetical protein
MEADHRWERRTQRLAQQEKEEAEEESQEEEKPEEEEESTPTEQATGEDNVNASAEKASAENKEGDIVTSQCTVLIQGRSIWKRGYS